MSNTSPYWFAPDGDDEPTMWRNRDGSDSGLDLDPPPVPVMRRCENPEVFDLLHEWAVEPSIRREDVEKCHAWMRERQAYWGNDAPPSSRPSANEERADVWDVAAEGLKTLLENGRWSS